MKYFNTIKKVFFIILLTIGVSCSEEFLEVVPKGVVILQSTDDYNYALNGLEFANSMTKTYRSLMSKSIEACGIDPSFSRYFNGNHERVFFEWTPEFITAESQNVASDLLLGDQFLKQLYTFNKVINEVLESSGGSEAQKRQVWAEALGGRANIYLRLINLYAQPYNAATASSDLGFPIITEADVNIGGVVRASTQEVYDLIINDLTSAIPYLDTNINQRIRMSKGAAQAFLGETYLNMNRYDEALQQFNDALVTLTSNTGIPVGLYDYNVTTLPGGVHAASFRGPREVFFGSNFQKVYTKGSANSIGNWFFDWLLLNPETSALYGSSDLRLSHWYIRTPFRSPVEYPVPGVYNLGGKSFSYDPLGIDMPNIYLMRAECKARTNDLNGAIADLEFLRRHRMDLADAAVPTGLSQENLIRFVIEERTREFALMGTTWFDTRRLWHDPLFQDKKPYMHTLYNADGSVQNTFTLTEERLVLQFPQSILTSNPGIIKNP